MTRDIDILDQMSPDETHLPPSARTWARIVSGCLELRDPNSGQDPDPARKARDQYLIERSRLWTRRLPPAPLDAPTDESRWSDEPADEYQPRTTSAWRLVTPDPTSLAWQWSGLQPYATAPTRVTGSWNLHGTDHRATVGYEMPAADPWDTWADITGVPCPHPGCSQALVWYEAGYVPGYRVCMRPVDARSYDERSIRHRWLYYRGVLVLDRRT